MAGKGKKTTMAKDIVVVSMRPKNLLRAVLPGYIIFGMVAGILAGPLRSFLGEGPIWTPILIILVILAVCVRVARLILYRHHRRGVNYIRNEEWQKAIAAYEKSYDFFTRHDWLDRYRAWLLMNGTALGYREAALVSIAMVHGRSGDIPAYKSAVKRVLAEFPESRIAKNSLEFLEAVEAQAGK